MRSLAVVGVLAVGSCNPLMGDAPPVDDAVIVARVTECNQPGDSPKAAYDYMQVGFANVFAACEAFFVSATRFQQHVLAANTALDAGLTGTSAILNATATTATALKAITITTAGVTFGKALLNDLVTVYTFGTHLYKVRQLVHDDMNKFIQDAQKTPPTDTCVAYAQVQYLATKCTLANMQALLDAQVAIPSKTVDKPEVALIPPAQPGVKTRGFSARVVPLSAVPTGPIPSLSSTVVPLPPR